MYWLSSCQLKPHFFILFKKSVLLSTFSNKNPYFYKLFCKCVNAFCIKFILQFFYT